MFSLKEQGCGTIVHMGRVRDRNVLPCGGILCVDEWTGVMWLCVNMVQNIRTVNG